MVIAESWVTRHQPAFLAYIAHWRPPSISHDPSPSASQGLVPADPSLSVSQGYSSPSPSASLGLVPADPNLAECLTRLLKPPSASEPTPALVPD